jgi:hypothetical protein
MEGGSSYNDDGHQDGHQIPTAVHAPTIDAPYVPQSPMFMECRYVKTGKNCTMIGDSFPASDFSSTILFIRDIRK